MIGDLVGLDLSVRSTGWARLRSGPPAVVDVGTIKPPSKLSGVQRNVWILKRLRDGPLADPRSISGVAVEGYSFNSAGAAMTILAELGGVVRYFLYQSDLPFAEVAPASVKKVALGKGSGKGVTKEAVLVAAVQRLKYSGFSTDEADARWILEAFLHATKHKARTALPVSHLEGKAIPALRDVYRWVA